MRVLKYPKVYLIARPQIVEEGLNQFLKDNDLAWPTPTEGVTSAERLVEVAGRCCYQSWGKKAGSKTNFRYIQNLVGRNEDGSWKEGPAHGSVCEHPCWSFLVCGCGRGMTQEQIRHRAGWAYCLDGDTLIYSERLVHGIREGAKKRTIKSIYEKTKTHHGRSRLKLMKLRCLDESANKFTSGKISNVFFSGVKPVFEITLEDNKRITCSKEHKFLTKSGWGTLTDIVGGLNVSDNGVAVYSKIESIAVNGCPLHQDKDWLIENYIIKDMRLSELAVLSGVSIHCIRKWLRKHNVHKQNGSWWKGKSPWNKGKKYHFNKPRIYSEDGYRRLREGRLGEKNNFWKGGTSKESSKIRRGLGQISKMVYLRDDYTCRLCHNKGGKLTIHHVIPIWADKSLAKELDNLVTLCRECHFKVNNHEMEYAEKFGAHPEVVAIINSEKKRVYRGTVFVPKYRKIVAIKYVGERETYDIEMEGPHHNFVANGIITHNSEQSSRFCDYEREPEEGTWTPGFCVPPMAQLSKETSDKMAEMLRESRERYIRLLSDIEKDLESNHAFIEKLKIKYPNEREQSRILRKAARGAARDILPIATESIMTMSANARALWNCIYLRGNEHSEAVIRLIYVQLAKIMEKEMPALFHGIKYGVGWDGLEVVMMPRDKI